MAGTAAAPRDAVGAEAQEAMRIARPVAIGVRQIALCRMPIAMYIGSR
jgi:hypothetical protein